jgi:ABC-type glycerol-3-phosphate transport system substrate-binding protein
MLHAHSPAYFFFKGQGSWVTPETLGVAHMPGNFATPNSHGLGISKGSKNPELAWDFLKFITDVGQAGELGERRKLVTGNVAVDTATLAKLQKDDPTVVHGAEDAARAHRQDDRQLALRQRQPRQGSVLAGSAEARCSDARMRRPRWRMRRRRWRGS